MVLLLSFEKFEQLFVLSIPVVSILKELFQIVEVIILLIIIINLLDIVLFTPRPIKSIPSIKYKFPIWGILDLIFPYASSFQDSPCVKFQRLAKQYGDVLQLRLGTKQVLVANTYESIFQLYTGGATKSNNSRPMSHTFHKVLSQSGVFTVGSTPFGETYVKSRKFLGNLLNSKASKDYYSAIIEREANKMMSRILDQCYNKENATVQLDFTREAQFFHLAVALNLTYGYDIDYSDELQRKQAVEIMYVENQITMVRSHVQNVQDYLPGFIRFFVNLWCQNPQVSKDLYRRRNEYLKRYSDYALDNLNSKNPNMKKSLMHYYFTEGKDTVTPSQIGSVCLTMVSAGLDNVPLNFQYMVMQLTQSPHIVTKAYHEIMKCYNHDVAKAWSECHFELKCAYISAIVKETLRLFTVLPMALPRQTTKEIVYQNAVIPEGTTIFMNCWGVGSVSATFGIWYRFKNVSW
ncbi:unnamed protein product [Ambrosiozyma monospora]|uniref:Unnamed protein product n=1 Tax=Ambrosiozyma monospora TaxID=43982 RepID=A0ACB5SRN7_AMBMO|nr:unnamed protein product [Ambrosiozyma monospora]